MPDGRTPLLPRIAARIRREGPLRLDRFMEMALQDPAHGYYRRGDPIGRTGDFITAPEVSQLFGELVGLWLAERWMTMGRPAPVRLVELGPGRGTLMADIWRACRVVPGFHEAARIHLVESNMRLRAEQKKRLPQACWHADLTDLPDGPLLVIANEFFDALPIRQFLREAGGWRERAVGFDDRTGRLVWTDVPVAEADLRAFLPERLAAEAGEGAIIEVAPAARAVASALARRLAAGGGAALIIDYGYEGPALGDTLQAVHRHRPADPLARPGAQDLTAHVDFTPLGLAARNAGLAVFGPVPQGRFLLELGLAVRLERLCRGKPPVVVEALHAGARRLVDPQEMGALFQVMAWTGIAGTPPGFGSGPPG
ncbi:MAG: class I SAM-dependent methyltransferase [Alphaproteobacteria bacterium]|nr:MAG: class I SAM-dependent methyltransferase [Alphaproteobacteria bacterium]